MNYVKEHPLKLLNKFNRNIKSVNMSKKAKAKTTKSEVKEKIAPVC